MLLGLSAHCAVICVCSIVWLMYVSLTAVHLFANYQAVTSVIMDTFNQSRLHIVISHWLSSQQVMSTSRANYQEPVFTGCLTTALLFHCALGYITRADVMGSISHPYFYK